MCARPIVNFAEPGSGDASDRLVIEERIGRAYCILNVIEFEGHRLVSLYNPWGWDESTKWKGPWSDDSAEWTPKYKRALHYTNSDSGVFWMAFEDFVRNFDSVGYCKLIQDSNAVLIRGEWSRELCGSVGHAFRRNPQFLLKSDITCNVVVSLIQDAGVLSNRGSGLGGASAHIVALRNKGRMATSLNDHPITDYSKFTSAPITNINFQVKQKQLNFY
jgi:hypothetical protein